MDQSLIDDATYEAIYWWNRDEAYYHQYFSKFDIIYHDKDLLKFFTNKIFEVFLREYSIRRNISSGYQNVDKFIDELFEFNFIKRVKNGETNVIDKTSDAIKSKGNSTKRNTKSLLSKLAFLINPSSFYLYDTLAKNSIYKIYEQKNEMTHQKLEDYSNFIVFTDLLKNQISQEGLFENSYVILKKFINTQANSFFSKDNQAFEMRITDKYLWLLQNENSRDLKNEKYIDLLKT